MESACIIWMTEKADTSDGFKSKFNTLHPFTIIPQSRLEREDYRILGASSKNLVVHMIQQIKIGKTWCRRSMNQIEICQTNSGEHDFAHALFIPGSDSIIIQWSKSPGSNKYWIRNIRYNNTYAMARGRPSNRPNEVKGVWLAPGQPLESDMLWKIEPAPTSGSYR